MSRHPGETAQHSDDEPNRLAGEADFLTLYSAFREQLDHSEAARQVLDSRQGPLTFSVRAMSTANRSLISLYGISAGNDGFYGMVTWMNSRTGRNGFAEFMAGSDAEVHCSGNSTRRLTSEELPQWRQSLGFDLPTFDNSAEPLQARQLATVTQQLRRTDTKTHYALTDTGAQWFA